MKATPSLTMIGILGSFVEKAAVAGQNAQSSLTSDYQRPFAGVSLRHLSERGSLTASRARSLVEFVLNSEVDGLFGFLFLLFLFS